MREVTLRVRHHGEPESDISEKHPDVTLRSVSSMTGSTEKRKRIVEISGATASIDAFLDDFRKDETVINMNLLSPLDGSKVFVAITYDAYDWDSIAQRLTDMGIHYRMGTAISAGWERWTLYLEEEDELSEIVESLQRAGNQVNLIRDISLDKIDGRKQLELSRVLYDELTLRQREVLTTAIELGYYREKKDIGIEGISEAVGVAPTTAWEHLIRAEQKVMAEVGNHLSSGTTSQ